jgi:hypothetical protein
VKDGSIPERLARLETTVDAMSNTVADHETRIRTGESLGFRVLAYASVGAALGGAIVTALVAFL